MTPGWVAAPHSGQSSLYAHPWCQPSHLGSTGVSFSAHHLGCDRNSWGKHQGVHFQRLKIIDGQKGVHPVSYKERKWNSVEPRRSYSCPPLPEGHPPYIPGSSPSLRVSTSSVSICNWLESRSPPAGKRLSGFVAILGTCGSLRKVICPAELCPLSHPTRLAPTLIMAPSSVTPCQPTSTLIPYPSPSSRTPEPRLPSHN